MNNKFLNRNLPVFFFYKRLFVLIALVLLASCKSKTDWRDHYKKTATTSTKKLSNPKSSEDIASIMSVNENDLKNKKLYQIILKWYGTPYLFGGESENGIDCSGLTNVIFKNVYNIKLPRSSKDIAENIKRKYTKELDEGDLVFFSFGNSGTINHVGVYLQNNKFVHASTSKGVIISDLSEPWYEKTLIRCGTYKY